MRILVTGGGGYIGSILVGYLLQEHNVTVVDTFTHGQNSLAQFCSFRDFQAVRGDVRNVPLMKELLTNMDVIIPLAAIVGAPACDADPIAAHSVNVEQIDIICTHASKEQRIIIPITNSGYGIGEPDKECTELSPLKPISCYGRTKVEAEKIVLDRGNAISLRLATVFGMSPRMRLDLLVNDFVYRAITDRSLVLFEPQFRRNFIHVRDVARAFCHAIDRFGGMKDSPYNVGLSDANLTKEELCLAIVKHLPKFYWHTSKYGSDPDKRDYIVSNARIEATGFKCVFSLDDGIKELIKGCQAIKNSRYANC
jgi:nucleoside-diphosphate-sugar epimerase